MRHELPAFERRGLACAAGVAALALAGCGSSAPVNPVLNQRPTLFLTASPLPGDSVSYVVNLRWFANDADGEVTRVSYAVDPTADGDTAWVETTLHEVTIAFPSTTPSGTAASSPHVFVAKAWDNDGMASEPAYRGFTSYTVTPQSHILAPKPVTGGVTLTLTTITVVWEGTDPDGADTDEPVGYHYRLVSVQEVRETLGIPYATPSAADVQRFFERDAPDFADWERASPDSTYRTYENLSPGQQQYFAVVSFDEAGAYEPRFISGTNVLRFQPTVSLPLPAISIWNSFFSYSQVSGAFNLDERFVVRLDFVAGAPIEFEWVAEPWAGTQVTGYRWVLDPLNGDIFDETQRANESETWRWSTWSTSETRALLGPFPAGPAHDPPQHRLYVEARDNANRISIVILELRILEVTRERPLLVFDDYAANPDRIVNGDPNHPESYQPYFEFPTEAVLDTLLFAVGGVPYQRRPPGTLSLPGMFAGFDYDTLDSRFLLVDGIPLEILVGYEAVVILTGFIDAARTGTTTSGTPRMSAVRYICRPGAMNTLALYLELGGKVWLMGQGSLLAMIRAVGPPNNPPVTPREGTFLYDYLKARTTIYDADFRQPDWLTAATPYLPEFATPGRTWPPSTWSGGRGPVDDPRVGPSAERHRARWNGLPLLMLTQEFPTWPYPLPDRLPDVPWVSAPLEILEDQDPGPGTALASALDTLYLYRAHTYDNSTRTNSSDGKPFLFAYQGDDHGMVVWSSLPPWYFDREQMRQVVAVVLRNFGLTPNPNRQTWSGPGSAHRHLPSEPAR